MHTVEHDVQEVQENAVTSTKAPFNATVVLAGAALGGFLGATAAIIVTALLGVECSLRLVMASQLALSSAIMGAWIAASFTQVDRNDAASIPPSPSLAPVPVVVSFGPEHERRVAA